MRIKKEIISRIEKNLSVEAKLAEAFRKKDYKTIRRYLQKNEENGPLTTEASILIISECLNVSKEEILEREGIPA
jgi:hypothetical protein